MWIITDHITIKTSLLPARSICQDNQWLSHLNTRSVLARLREDVFYTIYNQPTFDPPQTIQACAFGRLSMIYHGKKQIYRYYPSQEEITWKRQVDYAYLDHLKKYAPTEFLKEMTPKHPSSNQSMAQDHRKGLVLEHPHHRALHTHFHQAVITHRQPHQASHYSTLSTTRPPSPPTNETPCITRRNPAFSSPTPSHHISAARQRHTLAYTTHPPLTSQAIIPNKI